VQGPERSRFLRDGVSRAQVLLRALLSRQEGAELKEGEKRVLGAWGPRFVVDFFKIDYFIINPCFFVTPPNHKKQNRCI
jgi:hypothetical protein